MELPAYELFYDELLLVHGPLQVGVHELEDEVQVPVVLGSVDVQKSDDVRVVTVKLYHSTITVEQLFIIFVYNYIVVKLLM